MGFPSVQLVKNLPAMLRPGFDPWVGKIPWRRKWQPTAWEIPWTEEPGGLCGLQKSQTLVTEQHKMKMNYTTHSVRRAAIKIF